uniref:AAA family ATPase n=1 Tax=Clostridium perfringens TaxID=1502 RepID=UPI0039E7BB6A
MSKNLIMYEKEEYPFLRKEYLDKGYLIFSFSKLSSNYQSTIHNEKLLIDISSLAEAVKNKTIDIFTIEKLFYKLEEQINVESEIQFVIDNNEEEALYQLRYCFEDVIRYKSKEDLPIQCKNPELDKIEIKKITQLNDNKFNEFFEIFNSRLYGHEKFKYEFRKEVESFCIFNKLGEHKILSFFLMGDSGVGKTEVARSIHKAFNSKKELVKINFGNYSSQDALNSLIGSPRGYIGSEGGELFDKISRSDAGVILIDEFEKANSTIFNYFLEMLETGKATNSQGEEIDLNGYIIIFTSNVHRENFYSSFSPELISRFSYIGYFNLLTEEDKKKYVAFRVNQIISKYNSVIGKLPSNAYSSIVEKINVKNYDNMRKLNKKINDVFLEYIKEYKMEN